MSRTDTRPASILRFAVFGALWTVLLAGIALLIIVGMFWWQAWSLSNKPPTEIQRSVGSEQEALEKTLDAYKTQVDDLERLVTLLIGLSSFYALVLGVSSYLTVQPFIDRSKENAQQIERYREGMEKALPAFTNFGTNVSMGIERLTSLLPNQKERDDFWENLSENEKQEILFLERSLAFVEVLDWSDKRIALLYQGLGKFYSAWYMVAGTENDGKTVGVSAQNVAAQGNGINAIQGLAVRAYFYLDRAVRRDPKNFAALNDFGVTCADMSKLPSTKSLGSSDEYDRRAWSSWEDSLRIQPEQQRARYNQANALKRQGKIEDAIKELQEALRRKVWETEPNPLRIKDIYYNLACYQSLLGAQYEKAGRLWYLLLERSRANLLKGCEDYNPGTRVRKETLKALKADSQPSGDLIWLWTKMPEAVEKAQLKLE
jgi:tetratricopeptide (TPR) repeat protein